MLYRWNGPANSGITAYAGKPEQKDIRLVVGRAVELPTDDPNLASWIANNVAKGLLEAV